MRKTNIIYQLNIEDIQTVAEEILERKLNDDELKAVSNKVGDYIPWFDAIENTFYDLGIK